MTDTVSANPNAGAPLLTLHHDLLWLIIKMHTDIFCRPAGGFFDDIIGTDEGALKMARTYSQVCREWRDFMLQSQSLWGKMMDLDDLERSGDLWRKEVLRRSGNSLLWIKGNLTRVSKPKSPPILPFFFSMLNDHWDRVQKLVITVKYSKKDVQHWGVIYRAAPHLQTFKVVTFRHDILPSPIPLFADDAPCLEEFHANNFAFLPQALWISNLRTLQLGFPINILDAMRTVEMTPQLKSLHIHQALARETKSFLPHIYLGEIADLQLSCDFPTASKILDHITAQDGCSLSVDATIFEDNFVHPDSRKPLSKFITGYFRGRRPTSISLAYWISHFYLSDTTGCSSGSIFSLTRCGKGLTEAISSIFDVFQPQELGYVRELQLDIFSSRRTEIPPGMFTNFFRALSSINTLSCSEETISSVLDTPKSAAECFFPLLKTVKLDESGDLNLDPSPIIQFLQSRIEAVHPIAVLDLTKCNPYRLKPLECLGEISGLQIRWRSWEETLEYDCGGDNPEKLCFLRGLEED